MENGLFFQFSPKINFQCAQWDARCEKSLKALQNTTSDKCKLLSLTEFETVNLWKFDTYMSTGPHWTPSSSSSLTHLQHTTPFEDEIGHHEVQPPALVAVYCYSVLRNRNKYTRLDRWARASRLQCCCSPFLLSSLGRESVMQWMNACLESGRADGM